MLSTDVRAAPNLQRRDNQVPQNRDRRVLGETKNRKMTHVEIVELCKRRTNDPPMAKSAMHVARRIITSKCAGHQKQCMKYMNHMSPFVMVINGYNENLNDKDYFIDTADTVSASRVSSSQDSAFATLKIGPGRKSLSFKIDTGSTANILSCSHFSLLKVNTLYKPLSRI